MVVGLALLAFVFSFLPVLLVQRALSRSVAGLLLTSLAQILLTAVALWGMFRYAGHVAEQQGEAAGIGMMIALAIPGLGFAMVLNGAVALWLLARIWLRGRRA
ncbi:MAG: hypothetical protein RIR62_1144 [Pseudomonadota bacterium]